MAASWRSQARILVRTPSTTSEPARGLQLARRETSRPARGRSHFAVADGPASLLPNGNVLVMASPVYPTNPPGVFNTPSHFFEFDGTNLTQVADSPNAASFISYQGPCSFFLPGEVLLTA